MSKPQLKYLANYAPSLQAKIAALIESGKLAEVLLQRYPVAHEHVNDKALRTYTMALKNRFMKQAAPLSKVCYDGKIHVVNNALGLHSYVARVQGGKLKSKNEIRISAVFKKSPEAFLNMIVVHELAHLKEKEHNKGFYQLCQRMLPEYHQLEFDMRLYLTLLEQGVDLYS